MSDIEQKCRVALQALSDWAVTYAPDMCDPETVEKAKARIFEHGTLAYIANATDQLRAAILSLSLSETEKRGKEARAKALEEAAKVADQYVWDDHALAQATSLGKAVHHQSVEIAAAIRALQSEER